MARRTNLRVLSGCSWLGLALPDIIATVITMAKIASAVPRCAVMISGGSFHSTVRPPSTICITSKTGNISDGINICRSLRTQTRTLITRAIIRTLTIEAA